MANVRAATARSDFDAVGGGEAAVKFVPHTVPTSVVGAGKDAPNERDVIDELRELDEKENERDGATDDWAERPEAECRDCEGEC